MYICENGHVFAEPIEEREYVGNGIYETWGYCPECGASFSQAFRCKVCGEWVAEEDYTGGMCPACWGFSENEDNEQ